LQLLFAKFPRLVPSHSSPLSINLLPHFSAAQLAVVNSHDAEQDNDPVSNPKSWQDFIAPKTETEFDPLSHSSSLFIIPLPQIPEFPEHPVKSYCLHFLVVVISHFIFPVPIEPNNEECSAQLPVYDEPRLFPSQISSLSIIPFPHVGFALHALVSIKQFGPQDRVPDKNPKSAHESIAPNLLLSQCSFEFIIESPQEICSSQLVRISLQPVSQDRVPPIDVAQSEHESDSS